MSSLSAPRKTKKIWFAEKVRKSSEKDRACWTSLQCLLRWMTLVLSSCRNVVSGTREIQGLLDQQRIDWFRQNPSSYEAVGNASGTESSARATSGAFLHCPVLLMKLQRPVRHIPRWTCETSSWNVNTCGSSGFIQKSSDHILLCTFNYWGVSDEAFAGASGCELIAEFFSNVANCSRNEGMNLFLSYTLKQNFFKISTGLCHVSYWGTPRKTGPALSVAMASVPPTVTSTPPSSSATAAPRPRQAVRWNPISWTCGGCCPPNNTGWNSPIPTGREPEQNEMLRVQ